MNHLGLYLGGEGGIRTLGDVATTPDFESGTFDHSATSPQRRLANDYSANFLRYIHPLVPGERVIVKILLAPMEGLLDATLRDLLTRVGGVDRCVGEFVRVTDSVLPERVFLRTLPELRHGSRTQAGTVQRMHQFVLALGILEPGLEATRNAGGLREQDAHKSDQVVIPAS